MNSMNIKPENKIALDILHGYFNADFDNYALDDRLSVLGVTSALKLFKEYMGCLYDDTRNHNWVDFYDSETQFFLSSWLYFLSNNVDAFDLQTIYGISWGTPPSWNKVFHRINTAKMLNSDIFYMPPITNKLLNKNGNFGATRIVKKLSNVALTRPPEIVHAQWRIFGKQKSIKEIIKFIPPSIINNRIINYLIPSDHLAFVLQESLVNVAAQNIPIFARPIIT